MKGRVFWAEGTENEKFYVSLSELDKFLEFW